MIRPCRHYSPQRSSSNRLMCLPHLKTHAQLLLLVLTAFQPHTLKAQSPDQVLTLPEVTVTSIQGKFTLRSKDAFRERFSELAPPPLGQSFQPAKMLPGTRLRPNLRLFRMDNGRGWSIPDTEPPGVQHALVSFPGIGGCMIVDGSINLPSLNPPADETGMTVTFDQHPTSTGDMFLNINAAQLAAKGGKVFRLKNHFTPNGDTNAGKMWLTTSGGRFFIHDGFSIASSTYACLVCVFDGTASIQELTSKQQADVKAGSAVMITSTGISQPRALTKAEQSYDIGCKLAVLGRAVPARLPPTMKTSAPTSLPGTKINSLGMVFVPVPDTKVLMCVHETRWQDFAAYLTTVPPLLDGKPRAYANGLWGWEDHPVTTSWEGAQAFCIWLSQKEGQKYRLPTDEEWSHAVGIGGKERRKQDTTPKELSKNGPKSYPWGDAFPPPPGCANLGDASYNLVRHGKEGLHLNNYDDGFVRTAPVMNFKPSKTGMFDMSGNVAEWCADWFDEKRTTRVTRGGSYLESRPEELTSSSRAAGPPDISNNGLTGFRIVLELP